MWQQHLLDVANYCHDMMLLCGHVVGYNPDKNEENEREKSAREGGTHQSLEQHFKGSYDKEVWGVNDAKCENDNESEDLEEITDFVVVEGNEKSHRGDEVLVEIYRSSENITTYRVKKSNHLAACLVHFANIYRRRVGDFEFIYNGNSINGLSSANSIQSLGFVPEQGKPLRIIAVLRPENAAGDHSGIISIRVRDISGEVTFFRIKLDTKMVNVFEAYSSRKGVSREDLRFIFDGAWINGESTPRMLELEDGDEIDVMIAQTGC
jgi:hypothetical protein